MDPSVNKTYQATVKAGKSYSYPGALPLGTEVAISEGEPPSADVMTWNEAESRVCYVHEIATPRWREQQNLGGVNLWSSTECSGVVATVRSVCPHQARSRFGQDPVLVGEEIHPSLPRPHWRGNRGFVLYVVAGVIRLDARRDRIAQVEAPPQRSHGLVLGGRTGERGAPRTD